MSDRIKARLAAVCAASLMLLAGCSVKSSEANASKPTIDDCKNWDGKTRCPKACFAPPVEAGSIKTYSPRFDNGTVTAGATDKNQARLESIYANDLGPRKVEFDLGDPEAGDTPNNEEHVDVFIQLTARGMRLVVDSAALPPRDGCPADGPTLCLLDTRYDVSEATDSAARLARKGRVSESDDKTSEMLVKYDWMRLYNMLMEVKAEHPATSFVRLRADAGLPYALMIRTMDVAREQLEEDRYDLRESFRSAGPRLAEGADEARRYALFPRPIIQLPQLKN